LVDLLEKYLLLAWAMAALCLDIKYVIHLKVRWLPTLHKTLEEITALLMQKVYHISVNKQTQTFLCDTS